MDLPPNRRLRLAAASLTVLAAVAGGCGQTEPPAEEPPPETTSTTDSPPATDPPPATDGQVRVTGTVVEGVEPGCLLLDTGETRYLLLDGDPAQLESGRRVTVTGTAAPGTPTTCMEGEPLRVTDITPTE